MSDVSAIVASVILTFSILVLITTYVVVRDK